MAITVVSSVPATMAAGAIAAVVMREIPAADKFCRLVPPIKQEHSKKKGRNRPFFLLCVVCQKELVGK